MAEARPARAVDAAQLARAMGNKLGDADRGCLRRPTIHRVIPCLQSQEDTSPYEPKLISIGPFHRDKEPLRPMEEHKWRYLHDLLSRNAVDNLEKCIVAVGARLADVRGEYSDRLSKEEIADEKLVEMMVLDGCFILEYFTKFVLRQADPNLSSTMMWALNLLRVDLLLLENQIPFFVLEALLEAMAPGPFNLSLVDMVLINLSDRTVLNLQQAGLINLPPRIFHLLHFYHVIFASSQPPKEPPSSCWRATHNGIRKMGKAIPTVRRRLLAPAAARRTFKYGPPSSDSNGRLSWDPSKTLLSTVIPSATKLREAGVRIARRELTRGSLDMLVQVRFVQGTLGLPTLVLSRHEYARIRNLVTFEQCCHGSTGSSFTSYAYLMKQLMRTDRDVELLQSCGVVVNYLGSIGDVLQYFQNAFEGASLHGGFRFGDLVQDVREYCDLV